VINNGDASSSSIIVSDAIEFIKIGIEAFYPTGLHKLQLAKSLLTGSSEDKRASILLAKLAEDTITMTLIPRALPQSNIRISVTNVSGSNTIPIDIGQRATIKELKKAISSSWSTYNVKRQRIVFAGQEWSDDTLSLADAGIQTGSIVKSVLKGSSSSSSSNGTDVIKEKKSKSDNMIYIEEKAASIPSSSSLLGMAGGAANYYAAQPSIYASIPPAG
jgi:hypothetical protein